ncbi:MAG: beta-lactamase family protein [Oscillospiraceae bacterium]|nr:beta-lactamase family protein [Oscillospiraceae bacterium]
MKMLIPENPEILSAVVMKNGEIIAATEQTDKLYPQYSIMKSLVALVIGRLCAEGQLTPRTTVGQVLHTGSAAISNISLDALMSMTSGIEQKLLFADRDDCPDYLKACCEASVEIPENGEKPGFCYNNACAYLAGRMAETQEDTSLETQIMDYIFKPLGITEYAFEYDPQGHVFGASGLQLSTADLAKLGYGIMTGKICSSPWLRACTRPRSADSKGMPYGYFFWVLSNGFYMSGKWGQRCFVLPDYQAVIAVNSNMQGKDTVNSYIIRQLLPLLAE